MPNINTLATLPQEAKTFYDKTLLQRLLPTLVFAKYGQKKSLKSRSGKTIEFRKFMSLKPATTPLTEGVTPAGKELAMTSVTATVEQYGDFVEISDMLDLTGIDPVLVEAAEILGEQAGLTIDNVVRDIICAGTNVQYAKGKESTDAITKADVFSACPLNFARTVNHPQIRINQYFQKNPRRIFVSPFTGVGALDLADIHPFHYGAYQSHRIIFCYEYFCFYW